jgi:hypothetical protein
MLQSHSVPSGAALRMVKCGVTLYRDLNEQKMCVRTIDGTLGFQ